MEKIHLQWISMAFFLYISVAAESIHHRHVSHLISNLPGQPAVSFQQFAGYVTVGYKKQRSLFYYFVEAEIDPASKPLVLWLNGGPGCSSVGAGLFCEHGPFKPSGDILLENEYSWNREANIIYLESPAGVGFSYSTDESFYTTVNDEITAKDNLVFLNRWFDMYPQYKGRDFFIAGESYAGHYIPELAQLIVNSNTTINLKGIALGNPLLDFNTDFNSRAEYLWSHGLISDGTFSDFTKICNFSQMRREVGAGAISRSCFEVHRKVISEVSRFVNSYDVTLDICLPSIVSQGQVLNQMHDTHKIDVCVEDETVKYLNRADVQKAIHAELKGVASWSVCSDISQEQKLSLRVHCRGSVLKYAKKDLELPMIPILKKLIKFGVKVFVYSGDQDSVIPLTGTRTIVDGLGKELGLNTTVSYRVWFEGRQVGGWTQVYGDMLLSFATIRGASHEAPFSQPERSLVLFRNFLKGQALPVSNQL